MVAANGTLGSNNSGIVAVSGSVLDLIGSNEVTENISSGVLLLDGSTMRSFNATITGNGGDGIALVRH